MTQKIIKVEGMSCEHCRNAVESALAKLNGVSSAEDRYALEPLFF